MKKQVRAQIVEELGLGSWEMRGRGVKVSLFGGQDPKNPKVCSESLRNPGVNGQG